MFFSIGLICFILGFLITRLFGATAVEVVYLKRMHRSDYVGITLGFVGIILMLGSGVVKLWHYMP